MDDIALYALGNMTNSSSAMFERRRRILNEARKMIGSGGLDAFSIRELCKRAGVASRTLYYAFDSKENIIALAIGSYFEEFERRLQFDRHPASLESAIQQQITTTLRNQQIPNYLKAVAALYFSPSLHPRIREVLLTIGGRAWKPWIQTLVLHRQLQKGVDGETLLIDLSNLLFAKVHEWGLGILSNEEFQDRTIDAVLIHLAGAAKGVALSTVRDAFVRWRGDSGYHAGLIADARARLAAMSSDRSDQQP
ncbi:TetR/AcrR family transcriptional regulator [Sphingobium sp.]|uniref:TetR/AcrR family transcriptional regulator n=1 Tax=Sphingobium sp. TaxID=1912891 RepID=UPI0028BD67C2|nr:TetR/AcrR family transcriptional regulator [Sphingobium sp.]